MEGMKPTQQQLMARIVERAQEDAMQFEVPDYVVYLDKDHAKFVYPPEMHAKIDAGWTQGEWSEDDVRKRIVDYIPHAFRWANERLDYETMRACGHFIAWTWLLGDHEFSDELIGQEWSGFGKPCFRKVAERYGVAWEPLDDGVIAEMPDLGIDLDADGGVTVNLIEGSPSPQRSYEDIVDAAWEESNPKS